MHSNLSSTERLYKELYAAFTHYNAALFNNRLPEVVLVLHRDTKARGHFVDGIWTDTQTSSPLAEISLNPALLKERTIQEVLSTLVHEMCHLSQYQDGTASRKGYHNKEFAAIMLDCGLQVSHNGLPGGRTTGQSMTHYIIEGGVFEEATQSLFDSGWTFSFMETWVKNKKKAADKSKVKYTCPTCNQNAWAKQGASLSCGECSETMV